MKSLRRIVPQLFKLLLMAGFLVSVPSALASSTWYVDGVNGNDNNDCKSEQTACQTIGHAISLASSGDTIMVAAATYTENLTIGFNLKIIGDKASTTIIDGGGVNTVVTISSASAHVTLSKLTIQNGSAQYGGGINNSGTLTINNSTITANSAGSSGGGISHQGDALTINNSTITANSAGAFGGGINSENNSLTINNSTITANSACCSVISPYGGGINIYGGTLTIHRSTISGNSSTRDGSGILSSYATLTLNNSTISGNSATYPGMGAIGNNYGSLAVNNSTISGNAAIYGGGIFNQGYATLQNSIIANNSGGNCSGTMTSEGYNLSDDNTCNFSGPGDFNNTNPELGTLGNHGGPTQTIPLLEGSPAIDAGNPNGCTGGKGHLLKTDQRGKPRPDREDTGGCDMGAFERQRD